jgi:hypothetical protein
MVSRPRKQGKKSSMKPSEKLLELRLIKSYPRQVVWQVWLPFAPVKLTTTVTTGLINSAIFVNQAAITSFATRFGNTFVEYRIVRANVKARMFGSTNPGVLQMWYDEKSTASPTLVEAQERYILSENASSVDKRPTLSWTNADTLDLQYTAIGTSVTPVTFKVFTNNANFGSSVVATDYCEIEGAIQFQFRGLLGV